VKELLEQVLENNAAKEKKLKDQNIQLDQAKVRIVSLG